CLPAPYTRDKARPRLTRQPRPRPRAPLLTRTDAGGRALVNRQALTSERRQRALAFKTPGSPPQGFGVRAAAGAGIRLRMRAPCPAPHARPAWKPDLAPPLSGLTARISGLAPPPGGQYYGALRDGGFRQLSGLASGGGWGACLADKLVRKCDVLNRGFSGYNTRWAKIILPRLIRKEGGTDHPVVAVTIFFGANDSALKDENPKQHVPLDEYIANVKSMVRYLKSVEVPEYRIILITPPPLCEPAWEQECRLQGCKLNRLNSVVGEYASACLQVAQDCGTDALDLWTLMQRDEVKEQSRLLMGTQKWRSYGALPRDFSSYLSDGLHLSPKGNELLFSHLWPLIEKKVSSLPLLLPYWRDVAEAKPELSLLGDGDH
ncbi:Isoamyl acetate-hydrolyzing esterase 1, partial [Galemys pyrenaicus]